MLLGTLKFATCALYILPFSPSTTCMTNKGSVCSPVHRGDEYTLKITVEWDLTESFFVFPQD